MTGYTSANLFQINIVLSLTEKLGFVRSLPKLDTHIELIAIHVRVWNSVSDTIKIVRVVLTF